MKTQSNDKAKRRARRANAKKFDTMMKYYEEEQPVDMDSYFLDIDTYEDIEAAPSGLSLPQEKAECYYWYANCIISFIDSWIPDVENGGTSNS